MPWIRLTGRMVAMVDVAKVAAGGAHRGGPIRARVWPREAMEAAIITAAAGAGGQQRQRGRRRSGCSSRTRGGARCSC